MSDQISEVPVESARKAFWETASLVWLVPVFALVVVLWVAYVAYADRGPLIQISFDNASGVVAGETDLRFRDVIVGKVENVSFSSDLQHVLLSVRLDKEVVDFVDRSASFWIVRPRVTTQGVSGLQTVLSGVYVEGSWDAEKTGHVSNFKGLEDVPLISNNQKGTRIRLVATSDAGLTENSPILYRGIEVGRIGPATINLNGRAVRADAIIFSPYESLISTSTRFWDTSGFSFTLGPGGAAINFSSIASLLSGGITFATVVSGGQPLSDGDSFEVYADEVTARNSIFNATNDETLDITAIFADNVAGLEQGADVELTGLKVGTVTNLNGIIDESRFGDTHVRLLTTLTIDIGRLGLQDNPGAEEALQYLQLRVAEGLRARLATASILTGGLKVELVDQPDARQAAMDMEAQPYPIIPSTESSISDVSANAEGVFKRINNLPVEELMASAIDLLDSTRNLIDSEGVQQTPEEARALLSDLRGLTASPDIQAVPEAVIASLDQLKLALTTINEQDAVGRVLGAADAAGTAAADVSAAVGGVPDLVARIDELVVQIDAVAAKAENLPIEDLLTELTALSQSADALIGTEAAVELPASLNGALAEVQGLLAEVRAGSIIENANQTLASARGAADAVAASADDLPALLDRVNAVLNQANDTIASYDESSELSRSVRATMREIEQAAAAVTSLARTIERNPNSLLTGR